MGGTVGVIIKKESGEQIGMARWTNVMPYFFTRFELFYGKPEDWLKEFSAEWLNMKADYEKNKDTENYEFGMTSVYFPHDNLCPREYGLIAVDLKNRKIYSSQDYCNIGDLATYHILGRHDDNIENTEIKKYFDNGLLKKFKFYDIEHRVEKQVDITSLSFEEIITFLKELGSSRIKEFSHPLFANYTKENLDFYTTSFLLDTDWKFSIYHDRNFGLLKIRKEMEEDGFIFNESDDKEWKDYLSYSFCNLNDLELKTDEEYKKFKELYLEIFKEEHIVNNIELENRSIKSNY